MKILFLLQHLAASGPVRQLGTLTPALRQRGHETSLVALHEADDNWRKLWSGPVDVECLAGPPRGSLLALAHAVWRLRRRVEAERPDLLYAYHGDVARLVAWLATRGSRTKVVWGVQGAGRMRRTPAAVPCRLVSRSVPLLIASSGAARTRYAAGGFRCKRMVTITNGVDTSLFRPDPEARARVRAEWGITDEQVVGFVGRMDPALVAAVMRLRGDVRPIAVGEGTRIGFRADMPAVYNAFDILCSAPPWQGFPNTVAEAMACGVPCVVTGAGDSAELVGPFGIVVRTADAARLAACVRELLDLQLRPEDVRERITEGFTVVRWAEAMESELNAVAGSFPPMSSPADGARSGASVPRARSRP